MSPERDGDDNEKERPSTTVPKIKIKRPVMMIITRGRSIPEPETHCSARRVLR